MNPPHVQYLYHHNHAAYGREGKDFLV